MTASNGNGHSNGGGHIVSTMAELEALYPEPVYPPAKFKETDRITAAYQALVEASPFFALATSGPNGLDCSPRGDPKGFVRVLDGKTVIVPDRRGNNRIDSLRNLIHDPRVALLFLIPGMSETLRIVGRATISTDPELCTSFTMQGKAPRSVLVIAVEQVFFQCAKAIVRSKLWDPAIRVDRASLPTPGKILAEITDGKMGGEEHDRAAPERLKATIY
jgi:PPOX class probable FMN-dependent enzyme